MLKLQTETKNRQLKTTLQINKLQNHRREEKSGKEMMEISREKTSKIKINVPKQMSQEQTDFLLIKPLGAGQEVGRSCIYLEYKEKKILLDCGIHPGLNGIDSLPFIDNINPSEIDLLLITHFHLDHCGALPWFLLKTGFKGKCFMTHATRAIYPIILNDYVKVTQHSTPLMLYNKCDIEESLNKIEVIDFHVEKELHGIRFSGYHAGHVLGAAMFFIEIDGLRVLYTGDFSREEDRHLMAAEIPVLQPDVLIMEATHGTQIHEDRGNRESRLNGLVHGILSRGGKCLIPVFAIGSVQELLLILDEYWSNHPELHEIPIYYASALAQNCMKVYETFISSMNERIKQQIAINNPFIFKHVSNLRGIDHFDDSQPCVVLATPGMLQQGLSRQLFEKWCTDSKNGIIVAGYCVEGTLAKDILSHPDTITTIAGQTLPLKMSVDYISFSAHTDYKQTSEFIRILKPPHIVLVHGEMSEMGKLKAAIDREYEDDPTTDIEVYNPKNAQGVELYFRGEKAAKVLGSLALELPTPGHRLEGVLVKEDFKYYIMAAADLSKYTDVRICTLRQKLTVPCSGTLEYLQQYLKHVLGDVKLVASDGQRQILQICNEITISKENESEVVLGWTANPVSDMYADCIVSTILELKNSNVLIKYVPTLDEDRVHFTECLKTMLNDMFEPTALIDVIIGEKLTANVEGKIAEVNIQTLEVKCEEDKVLKEMISSSVLKLYNCLFAKTKDIDA